MSTNSECHVVKSDKTYFYFRRDENQFALSKRQGKLQDQQVFSCLAQQRINVKEELTGKHRQVISNQKKKKNCKKGICSKQGEEGHSKQPNLKLKPKQVLEKKQIPIPQHQNHSYQLFPNNPKNQKQSRKALFLWYGEGSGNHHSNKGRRVEEGVNVE